MLPQWRHCICHLSNVPNEHVFYRRLSKHFLLSSLWIHTIHILYIHTYMYISLNSHRFFSNPLLRSFSPFPSCGNWLLHVWIIKCNANICLIFNILSFRFVWFQRKQHVCIETSVDFKNLRHNHTAGMHWAAVANGWNACRLHRCR